MSPQPWFRSVLLVLVIQACGPASAQVIVPFETEWRYNQGGTNPGTSWREAVYDDSAWPTGMAALAVEDSASVTPYTNTVLSLTNAAGSRIITYYFRKHFTYSGPLDPGWLGLKTLIDDGVVVYLNGTEIYRLNMPPGPPTYGLLASNAVGEAEFKGVDFIPVNLVQGDNVIAAEVHQVTTISTDVVFGLQLANVNAPLLSAQPTNQVVARTYNATFAVSSSNETLLTYQWRKGNTDIPGATAATYTITNVQNSDAGTYSVRATNILGETISSNAELTVTVPYTFITMAGTPHAVGTNDGVGSAARFNSPRGIAVDSHGNLYVSDFFSHTIRKVTPAGVVSTIAGSPGIGGWRDGPGAEALFLNPRRASVDALGNIFVADHNNHVIRKISPDGMVTTVAGAPQQAGAANGTNDNARFDSPSDVAIDPAGNVYVADENNHAIRKVQPSGTNWIVTTIAGNLNQGGLADGTNNAARFRAPLGLDIDLQGNIYVVDNVAQTIRKIRPVGTNWVVTTMAGLGNNPGSADGLGSAARFLDPIGIAVDASGIVYVGDHGNMTVRKITPDGKVSTIAGLARSPGSTDGTGTAARFDESRSVAVDAKGNLYVSDAALGGPGGNNTVRKGWPADTIPILSLTTPHDLGPALEIPVLVETGTVTNLSAFSKATLQGSWTGIGFGVATNVPGLSYRMTVPKGGPMRFYKVQGR